MYIPRLLSIEFLKVLQIYRISEKFHLRKACVYSVKNSRMASRILQKCHQYGRERFWNLIVNLCLFWLSLNFRCSKVLFRKKSFIRFWALTCSFTHRLIFDVQQPLFASNLLFPIRICKLEYTDKATFITSSAFWRCYL